MTDQRYHKSDLSQQLSVRNPLDHLKLLLWILVYPQKLLDHREAFGEENESEVGRWLSSTLVWLLPVIPIIAAELRALLIKEPSSPVIYLWVSVLAILGWFLTGSLGEAKKLAKFYAALVIMLVILLSIFMFGTGGKTTNDAEEVVSYSTMLAPLTQLLLICAVLGLAASVASSLPSGVPVNVALIAASGMASVVAGGLAFLLVFIIVPVLSRFLSNQIQQNLGNGKSSHLMRGVFVFLVLGCILLVCVTF